MVSLPPHQKNKKGPILSDLETTVTKGMAPLKCPLASNNLGEKCAQAI